MTTCRQHAAARLTWAMSLTLGALKFPRPAMFRAAGPMRGTRPKARVPGQIKTLPRVIAGWTRQKGWCMLRGSGILRNFPLPCPKWRANPPAATPGCFSQVCGPGSNSRKAVSACVSSGVIPCPVPCTELRSQARKNNLPAPKSASIRGTTCRSVQRRPHGCGLQPRAPRPKSGWPSS